MTELLSPKQKKSSFGYPLAAPSQFSLSGLLPFLDI